MKNLLYFIVLSLLNICCSSVNEHKLTLFKKPPFTDPKVLVEMNGFYYCSGKDFDALMILFEDGKVIFHPYLQPSVPDTILKYTIENINFSLNGTIDYWGNYNIVNDDIFVEYIYENKPSMIFNTIEAYGNVIDKNTISITKIHCSRYKNKACKKFGYKEYNPPLVFKFHPRNFNVKKSFFYEKRWYRQNVWNNNKSPE